MHGIRLQKRIQGVLSSGCKTADCKCAKDAVSYTIKMSKMSDRRIKGYFDYVVPPLEGFWWQKKNGSDIAGFDYLDKSFLNWISVIRIRFVRYKKCRNILD